MFAAVGLVVAAARQKKGPEPAALRVGAAQVGPFEQIGEEALSEDTRDRAIRGKIIRDLDAMAALQFRAAQTLGRSES